MFKICNVIRRKKKFYDVNNTSRAHPLKHHRKCPKG